ncbi:MAG: hypothetical protein IJH04_07020 [Eggerthellaceae bacterium]|nr:hypothetical protein [Eggerthellaceae bacterium]
MEGFRGDSLVYANDSGGMLRHVDEVPNGLACGCACPACGQPLIARNGGSIRAHHFAHEGGSCEWGVEAAVSLLVEEVVLEACSVRLPDASYYDEEAREHKMMMPTGSLAVTGARQLEVPGRGAPCVEIDCATIAGVRWKVVIAPCLAHPLSPAQRSRFLAESALVVAIDMKAAREDALYDEGRHYDREETFALMQDPEFIGWLLSEPNESICWAVNGPLDAEVGRQAAIRTEREREHARRRQLERERAEEAKRARLAEEVETRRRKQELEAEARRSEEAKEEEKNSETEARKREEAEWRRQRALSEIAGCERRGHAGLPLARKGMKDFAVGCPQYGEADTVMQCGAYGFSTSHCPYCVRMGRNVLECAHPDARKGA